jgi:NAD(P)-dependent dehydrogenase (short-subunit alcohol dehydrogenase family)
MLVTLLDKAMDWTVVPGYSRLGAAVRDRLDPPGALDLEGRAVMVTGASSGIGEAVCDGLARAGARVHMVVRNLEKGEASRARVEVATGSEALELHQCDVSSLASVRAFADRILASGDLLHVLVNNAGVLPPERTHTEDGVELTFATNVLGPFLLTALLLPALRRCAPSRVVNVSSGGMYTEKLDADDPQLERREFDGSRFYAHTKRAEVALTEEWAERTVGEGVAFSSMHPGWVATPGVERSLPRFNRIMGPVLRDPAQGAETIVWLAGSPAAAEPSGGFWHDRRLRPKHRMPRTHESAEERRRFFDYCERLAGLGPGEAAGTV